MACDVMTHHIMLLCIKRHCLQQQYCVECCVFASVQIDVFIGSCMTSWMSHHYALLGRLVTPAKIHFAAKFSEFGNNSSHRSLRALSVVLYLFLDWCILITFSLISSGISFDCAIYYIVEVVKVLLKWWVERTGLTLIRSGCVWCNWTQLFI